MGKKILLIDDEPALCMTMGDRLRKHGYGVDCAGDAEQGSQKARQSAFDLIILDVMLPKNSGLSILNEIREAGIITPVLIFADRGRTEDAATGPRVSADDYMTKPFHMDDLVARVEALLRRTPTDRSASHHRL